ncbi:procathepsin L-like [Dreissena polymorpha]|uniref:Cathepsin L n=1 Tax=Dreissena polymorpha TaxID=45954 RepID=A0A9D4M1E6_DREPO|nr:procathepsin L-like [Dreissena polymorpha]KAH3868045.1 hypothetical protein DPMN_031181 [Dreissena polymorpha]
MIVNRDKDIGEMRSIWFSAVAFFVCLVPVFCGKHRSLEWQKTLDQERLASWEEFKQTHNKSYKSDNEEEKRFSIWMTTVKFIEHHNMEADKGRRSFWVAPNHFADLTEDEFASTMLGLRMEPSDEATDTEQSSSASSDDLSYLPREVDWRSKGYVTPVKNQKHCGSCYAFSAMGSLEGQHFRSTGILVSLSEQNIVDCSSNNKYHNKGCTGGTMNKAFNYVIDNGGVDTEESYPYEAEVSECRYKTEGRGATVRSYHVITRGSELELQRAVAVKGPVSIGIDVHDMHFRYYRTGVYQSGFCSSTHLNHGVLVVGFGTNEGDDFWIVKNSWGSSWGDDGYIKMARNKDNMCGVASMASYPIV